MRAYHGNHELKERFVAEIERHRAADQIAQGHYWSNNRGCAVGCSINSLMRIGDGARAKRDPLHFLRERIGTKTQRQIRHNQHTAYESLIGVPRILAKLEDGIFEGLPIERARVWPGEFAAAILVGADLSLVWPRFAVWLLVDAEHGVIRHAKTDKAREAIQQVATLHQQVVEGKTVDIATWRTAQSAAAAAADAAAAYAYAAAAAAYAAADAAAYAYADADAAADAARQQARIAQANKLLQLLQETAE